MNKQQFLLQKVAEEAGEIAYAASKCLTYGTETYHPKTPEVSNKIRLIYEIIDLLSMLEMLEEESVLIVDNHFKSESEIRNLMAEKKIKVKEQLEIAKANGYLKED